MESIIAPWRMAYLQEARKEGCVLCDNSLRREDLVVFNGKQSFIIVNRYPYTGGHLMIVPNNHVCNISDLSSEERLELFGLIDLSVKVLTKAIKPEGFNIGMNLGKVAGAGIDDHIHIHVVPRWCGDTNFMCVLGEVRIIPEDPVDTAQKLRPYFEKLRG